MKRTALIFSLIISLVIIPLSALAIPIHLDFGTSTLDITNQTQTIDSIDFSYTPENLGSEFAFINPLVPPFGPMTGISGNTGASGNSHLDIDFTAAPLTQLQYLLITFDLPGLTIYDGSEIYIIFYSGGGYSEEYGMSLTDPATGGTLAHYTTSPFDAVSIYFTMDAPIFQITDIAYDMVPEPGTIILFASGVLGLGAVRLFKRRT